MAPTTQASHEDLHAAMGFLDALERDDPSATAATARVVQPMAAEDIDALHLDPDRFIRSPRGQALIDEICADFSRLAEFADREGLGATSREIRTLCGRLPTDRAAAEYWTELLTDGREHLARVADALQDARIPLDERRGVLTELAKGLMHCGLRIRVELQQADQVLSGHRGRLRDTVRRAYAQYRDEVIRRVVIERTTEPSGRQTLDVHQLVYVLDALRLERSRLPMIAQRPHALDGLVNACRRALIESVTPNALAQWLAGECLDALRADLSRRLSEPLNLAENPRHLTLLRQLVNDLAERYGPLRPSSFIELDDDALPTLIDDPVLIALDIRRGMGIQALAAATSDEEVLVLGAGPTRLAVVATDGHFCHVRLGDPALEERHPLRPAHLARIVAEQPPSWQASAAAPARWPATLRRQLLERGLAGMGRAALTETSPNWMDDAETARRFGALMCDSLLPTWLKAVGQTELSATGLNALLDVILDRRDPASLMRELADLSPELPARMWNCFGSERLEGALARRQATMSRHVLVLLELAVPALEPVDRLRALTLPEAARDTSTTGVLFMRQYLQILATCGDQGLLTPLQTAHLLGRHLPAGEVLGAQFASGPWLHLLLEPLGQLCRRGTLSQEGLLSLMTAQTREGSSLPRVVDALREPGTAAIKTFVDWVLAEAGQGIARASVVELLAPRMSMALLQAPLQRVCADDDPEGLLAYLDGLLRVRQAGWLPDDRLWPVLCARIGQAHGPAVPLLVHTQQALGQITTLALLDWLRRAVRAGALNGDALLRVIDEPAAGGWAVLGTSLAADLHPPVRACMALLDTALEVGAIQPAALVQVLHHAVNERQPAALSMQPTRQPLGLGIRLPQRGGRPNRHALDVLWEGLLPSLAHGRCHPELVTSVLTRRDGQDTPREPLPEAILIGAYERLVNTVLFERAARAAGGEPGTSSPPHASGASGPGPSAAQAAPARALTPLSDALILSLLTCRSGPTRAPLLNVALRGGAAPRVAQLMRIGLQHLRAGRLTLAELTLWWQATNDDAVPALHVAIRSNDEASLRAYLQHLIEAFDAPDGTVFLDTADTRPHEAAIMLATLLGATNGDRLTAAQEAVRRGARPMLALYLETVLEARGKGMLDNAAVMQMLAPTSRFRDTSPGPLARSQEACQALLDAQRHRAAAQGWMAA